MKRLVSGMTLLGGAVLVVAYYAGAGAQRPNPPPAEPVRIDVAIVIDESISADGKVPRPDREHLGRQMRPARETGGMAVIAFAGDDPNRDILEERFERIPPEPHLHSEGGLPLDSDEARIENERLMTEWKQAASDVRSRNQKRFETLLDTVIERIARPRRARRTELFVAIVKIQRSLDASGSQRSWLIVYSDAREDSASKVPAPTISETTRLILVNSIGVNPAGDLVRLAPTVSQTPKGATAVIEAAASGPSE